MLVRTGLAGLTSRPCRLHRHRRTQAVSTCRLPSVSHLKHMNPIAEVWPQPVVHSPAPQSLASEIWKRSWSARYVQLGEFLMFLTMVGKWAAQSLTMPTDLHRAPISASYAPRLPPYLLRFLSERMVFVASCSVPRIELNAPFHVPGMSSYSPRYETECNGDYIAGHGFAGQSGAR
jgi:hypothetical protein